MTLTRRDLFPAAAALLAARPGSVDADVNGAGVQRAEFAQAIAVVKTWGDLEGQAFTYLGEGVRVKFGVSTKKMGRDGAVVVYCLTEGYSPGNRSRDDML